MHARSLLATYVCSYLGHIHDAKYIIFVGAQCAVNVYMMLKAYNLCQHTYINRYCICK